ncbi:MAG: hypothetical protein AAFO03_20550 [Bacteroidota bacterium]
MRYFKFAIASTLLFALSAAVLWRSFDSDASDNLNSQKEPTSKTQESPEAQFTKQLIAPPLEESYQPLQVHVVDAEQGALITLPSGTEIEVPANAFVDLEGNTVTGKVNISFREFHTAAEVILSGIPMKDWNENAENWENFSTAGMFEIRGTDEDQQPVKMVAERPVEVRLASRVEGTYDTWYFDEDKGDWDRQGQNTGEAFVPPPASTRNQASAGRDLPPRPTPPIEYDAEAIRVAFAGMNLVDFPEINDPENIALQYAGERGDEKDPEENEWIFDANWFQAELSKTGQKGVYQLYLENDDEEFTTQVKATLLPEAYSLAMEDYRKQLAAYEEALRNSEQNRLRVAKVLRNMEVGKFGVYNYDIYSRWEEPVFTQANFQPAGKDNWSMLEKVYLVTDNGQMSVSYPKWDWERFSFDRTRKNLLIGFTSDLQIVVLSPQDFVDQSMNLASQDRSGQQWNCLLEEHAITADDPVDLQSIIDSHFAS